MNILLCIKQVPDTAHITIDPVTHNIIRTGVESIINPYDLYAIEAAVALKEQYGGTVFVVTMGPPQAEHALKEAISRGADQGYLLTDQKFSGADTWATSYTLAQFIRYLEKKESQIDLIICGKQSIDGDTAQVGPEVAHNLNIPQITSVKKISSITETQIKVEALIDGGEAIIQSPLPTLITVVKEINTPRLVNLKQWFLGQNTQVTPLNHIDLDLDLNCIGLKGSPTRVNKIEGVNHIRSVKLLSGNPKSLAKQLLSIIKSDDIKQQKTAPQTVSNHHQNIMIIGAYHQHKIAPISYELIQSAQNLTGDTGTCSMILIGELNHKIILEAKRLNLDTVYLINDQSLKDYDASTYVAQLLPLIQKKTPNIILGGATIIGRSLLPRLAAALNTGITADCTELKICPKTEKLLQTRPAFGGNIMATIITKTTPQMATIRAGQTEISNHETGSPKIINIPIIDQTISHTTTLKTILRDEKGFNNNLMIVGGKGVGGKEQFDQLKKCAERLGGDIGASRAAVDAGWAPYHAQVGQTGKTVQPEIMISCGVSGAVQHLVGMQSSQLIIAINKDPAAPIFNVAHYGIVGDCNNIIHHLITALETV